MEKLNHKDLLKAGVHFGHLTRKWNPKMSEYIFMEQKGIHIIDLHKTIDCAFTAASSLKNIAKSGRKIMFVATKKQAKTFVSEKAKKLNMPYVTERWLGGMLTNFSTIRKSLKKLSAIESKESQDTYKTDFSKKERLMISRDKDKLEKVLGGISKLNRIPAALFVVDIKHEEIAINEARKLNIPIYGMVDTNSDPNLIDYEIPSNDDSFTSVSIIMEYISSAISDGLEEREKIKEEMRIKQEKEAASKEAAAKEEAVKEAKEAKKEQSKR
ncbi:MAG: 30S ribosomal protein S2 [Bacteroidota bacterium]|nr:30S ribosomal protein S2 [Bacteroidota bacterium]